jgi:hypothetical protein
MVFQHVRFLLVRLAAGAVLGLGLAACQAADADTGRVVERRFDPNIDLPRSEGLELVLRACTKCHDLGGLDAYKGYWNRVQWKEMVVAMVKNGAELLPAEQEVVADYLTRHFGPGTRKSR